VGITKKVTVLAVGLGLVTLSACGSSGDGDAGGDGGGSRTVTLVSHNSWAVSKDVVAAFEKQSGYQLKVLEDGDAGQAVNKAILTKDNPQGDVFFGVDNTLLSRALDNGLFQPYEAKGSDLVLDEYRADQDKHRVTPVDSGDVCVNYDKAWFDEHGLTPPKSLDDLVQPEYKDLLVTENASTSSPGLGFLLVAARRGHLRGPEAGDRADRRRRGHLLPPGRVRGTAEQRREPGGRQGPARLPAHQAVPGRHAAQHVRVSGARGRPGARGVHEVRAAGEESADHGPGEDRRQP